MKLRSLATQVSVVGLVALSGGIAATAALADDPTSGGGFRIEKVDENGKVLAGARYEATFCFYDTWAAPADRTWNCQTNSNWVTNAEGHLVLQDESDVNNGIPFEQYPLTLGCPYCGDESEITVVVGVREVEAPPGYDLDDTSRTYYPGYLADGQNKWGHANTNPGLESGVITKVSQADLGDVGDLRRAMGPDFNGYEALYVNKFTRSVLDVRLKDSVTGAPVVGATFTASLCTGDPESCSTLPGTFTSGSDGLLRDESGALLSTLVSPKVLDGAKVTLTQTKPADGYADVATTVLTHGANTRGWTGPGGLVESGPVDLSVVAKGVVPPTSEPTDPTSEPTDPTSDPTSPTAEPTSPTGQPTSQPTGATSAPSGSTSATGQPTSATGSASSSAATSSPSGPVVNTDNANGPDGLLRAPESPRWPSSGASSCDA